MTIKSSSFFWDASAVAQDRTAAVTGRNAGPVSLICCLPANGSRRITRRTLIEETRAANIGLLFCNCYHYSIRRHPRLPHRASTAMSSEGAQTVDNLLAEVCAEQHEQPVPNHLTSISRQLLEVVRVRPAL